MSDNYPDIATFIHAIDAEKQRFKRSEENSFSPLKLLPKEQQVNAFTKKKFSEVIDDGTKENIQQLIDIKMCLSRVIIMEDKNIKLIITGLQDISAK